MPASSSPLPITDRAPELAAAAAVQACAAEFLDVVPAAMNAVRSSMREHVADGLSIPQFRCLGYIARQPKVSVSEVAAFLGVTLATASAMVDRLVRAGYVSPMTSEADRRRTELSASAQGEAVLGEMRQAARRDIAATLMQASAEEIEALTQGLATMKRLFRRSPPVV